MLRTSDDVILALRARKDELGLSNALLDELAGLTTGHFDKMCGPSRIRGMSLPILLAIAGALGCGLQIVPDPEARVRSRWERRVERFVRTDQRVSKEAVRKATPIVAAELGSKGGRSRWDRASPEQRAAIGKFLAEQRAKKRYILNNDLQA